MKRILAVLAAAGMLAACASQPGIASLTREQRERVSTMEVLFGKGARPGTVIGRVTGSGCQKGVYDSRIDAEHEALEGLKIKAALIDADAVIQTTCQELTVDLFANCWGLIDCSGEAIRYEK